MKLFLLFLLLIPFSCSQSNLKSTFRNTEYDKDIIQALPLYDSLKNLIVDNIDTILKYRDSRNLVYDGSKGKLTGESSDFYQFYFDKGKATELSYGTNSHNQNLVNGVNAANLPTYIYFLAKKIFDALGKSKIEGFTLWRDSTIEIDAKEVLVKKTDIVISHSLIWKRGAPEKNNSYEFIRDTLIAPSWTYEIVVFKKDDF